MDLAKGWGARWEMARAQSAVVTGTAQPAVKAMERGLGAEERDSVSPLEGLNTVRLAQLQTAAVCLSGTCRLSGCSTRAAGWL